MYAVEGKYIIDIINKHKLNAQNSDEFNTAHVLSVCLEEILKHEKNCTQHFGMGLIDPNLSSPDATIRVYYVPQKRENK